MLKKFNALKNSFWKYIKAPKGRKIGRVIDAHKLEIKGVPWGFRRIIWGSQKIEGGVHFFRVLLHFCVTIFWTLPPPPSPLCASMGRVVVERKK